MWRYLVKKIGKEIAREGVKFGGRRREERKNRENREMVHAKLVRKFRVKLTLNIGLT